VTLSDIRTQQLSLGNILSLGWSIYQKYFVNILIVTLIANIPLNIAQEVITVPIINYILVTIFGVPWTMAVVFITERAVNNETMSFGDALRRSVDRWVSGVGTNIVAAIILLLLFLLLIVPGIIWAIYYTFSNQVVALRNKDGKPALDYSKALVQGQWGRVFGTGFILTLIAGGLYFGITYILGLLSTSPVINVVATTLGDITAAFTTVAITVLFLNLDYQKNIITTSNLSGTINLSA